jgi:hypothetical protein
MSLFSDLMGDDPLPARSILDNEDVLLERLLNSINIPVRVKSQKDEYSKSLKFLRKTTLVSMNNDILNFANQTGLVFRNIKDYTNEFKIKGFESRSIYFTNILNNESFIDKIGVLHTNNFKARVNGELKNVHLIIKDIQGCGKPNIEIIDCNKDKQLSLTNFNISGCFTKLNIKTRNLLNFNNFHSNNINEIHITCKCMCPRCGLIKQLSKLFNFNHKFHAWDNNDTLIELQLKSLNDIVEYYNSNYNTYIPEFPFDINDINLYDVLDVSNIDNLNKIVIKFNNSKLIMTKDINIAKMYWNWRYKNCDLPTTKDGWYIMFSSLDKINRRSY